MPGRLPLKYAGTALLLAVSFGFSSPAMAGFQWVAPTDNAVPLVAAQPMSSPAPVIISPQPMMEAPVAPAAGPEIISPLVITGTEPAAPAHILVPPPAAEPADNSVVVGFAKSVPLPVALRQILPPGYAFTVDQDVDMGTLVSFKGGRPWRETLRDTLAPAGLAMHEQGQMVSVGYANSKIVAVPDVRVEPAYRPGMEPKNFAIVGAAPQPVPQIISPAPIAVATDSGVIVPVPEEVIKIDPPHEVGNVAVAESWQAERGQYLRRVLEEWSRRSNVEFNWLSEYDYPLQASVSFSGNFENAVRTLLTGFENAHPQPVAELHTNANAGQMVLIVRTRGNTNSD